VTAGDRRVCDVRSRPGRIDLAVLGAPGERVRIDGAAPQDLRAEVSAGVSHPRLPPPPRALVGWERDPDGHFRLELEIPPRGRVDVALSY